MLPTVGLEAVLSEFDRVLELPAIRSVLVSRFPHRGTELSPEDDAFWARCAEADVPANLHVGLSGSPAGTPLQAHSFVGAFTGAFRFYDPPVRIAEMIYTQLFDRFPQLKVVFAEVDVGWVAMPKWDPKCPEDASWGPNPNAVNDCGVDVAVTFKVAWAGAEEKWPAAWKFLQQYQLSAEDQIPMMAAIDVRGEKLEQVTRAWVDENQARWQPWVEAAKR